MTGIYATDVAAFDHAVRLGESFDIIKKRLSTGLGNFSIYLVDGMTKDDTLLRLLEFLTDYKGTIVSVEEFLTLAMPYGEAVAVADAEALRTLLLSGQTVILASMLGAFGVAVDLRAYPARATEEPENDKVLQGARDGFVETLIYNTALVRRRIRDPRLTFRRHTVGRIGRTDVCVAFLSGIADEKYVREVEAAIDAVECDALPMGQQSLGEVLLPRGWLNPLPKVRYSERPDTAAAQLVEGNVLIFCDTSPMVMILPTSVFDFMQETDDYALPPLTGCYLRWVRHGAFLLSVFFTPIWLIAAANPTWLPEALRFILPSTTARLPLLAQLLLSEFIIDALKLASLNTPSLLAGSLSAIAGLILGDFAVNVGWLVPEVVLYMAFVAVVSFAQPGVELGFAFKFFRVLLEVLATLFGLVGFGVGVVLSAFLVVTNRTVAGKRYYLYPLIPFNGPALKRLVFRTKKSDSAPTGG